jgi:hypothetical protein
VATPIALEEGRNTIGRGRANDIQVEHPTISEAHCEIELLPEGAVVRDLGSTNGTFIDGEPVQVSVLKPGQKLQLGEVEVLYEQTAAGTASEPEVAVPEPLSIAPPAQTETCHCAQHPENRAVWVCTDCQRWLCRRCVKQVQLAENRRVTICLQCNGLCERMDEAALASGPRSYVGGLLAALGYPLRGTALLLLVGAGLFGAAMGSLAFGGPNPTGAMRVMRGFGLITGVVGYAWVLTGFGVGCYLLLYLREVLLSSVQGHPKPPAWPAMDLDTIKESAVQVLAWYLVAFAPLTLWKIFRPENQVVDPIGLGLFVLGGGYGLMALLAVGIYDSLAALNPLLVIVSIARVPTRYVLLCLLVAGLCLLKMGAEKYLADFPGLSQLTANVLSTYGVIVSLRALGWFYRSSEDQLAWS